jgi:hypothetical protein
LSTPTRSGYDHIQSIVIATEPSSAPPTDRQGRLELGLCTRCGLEPAEDGAEECKEHVVDKRARDARYRSNLRDERERQGLCVNCPVSGPPAKVSRGETSCLRCKVRRRRLPSTVDGVDNEVDNRRTRIASRTLTGEDGRTRYHGQDRRGQQTHAQLDAQDLGFARREITRGETGLEVYAVEVARSKAGDPEAMPRIQRDGLRSDAVGYLERASRHLEDVVERHGRGHAMKRHGRRDGDE